MGRSWAWTAPRITYMWRDLRKGTLLRKIENRDKLLSFKGMIFLVFKKKIIKFLWTVAVRYDYLKVQVLKVELLRKVDLKVKKQ